LDFLHLRTSVAEFGLVGRLHADAGPRASLLIVNGSFPTRDHMHDLPDAFPGANVLLVNIPGMLETPWSGLTPPELARGLDEIVARLLPGRPLVVMGSSTGNLLSLGMRAPEIRRFVAVEPFFQTKDLWPFIAWCQDRMARDPQDRPLAKFIWDFFGYRIDAVENRDYRGLLSGLPRPLDVVVGGVPLLPKRQVRPWPSLTSAEDRKALAALPDVTLHEAAGIGHGLMVAEAGAKLAKAVILAALREAAAASG
jgi:hypothetical protein